MEEHVVVCKTVKLVKLNNYPYLVYSLTIVSQLEAHPTPKLRIHKIWVLHHVSYMCIMFLNPPTFIFSMDLFELISIW